MTNIKQSLILQYKNLHNNEKLKTDIYGLERVKNIRIKSETNEENILCIQFNQKQQNIIKVKIANNFHKT